MKIKSLYIDGLHNAVNKTYEFGDLVYIFGNNGAGKSTILHAIQFALLGYIPGTPRNSKEAILRHSPKNDITVRLNLTGETDVSIERHINSKVNTIVTIPNSYDVSSITSELELPIFNFNDFVGQTANKLKEYFIKNILPTTEGNLDWKQILSESIMDCNFQDRDSIVEYGVDLIKDVNGEVLDQVIEANAKFKAEQSFNKTELQRLQNTIDSLIYYDDYVGPTDVKEINSELLSLGAIRDQLIKYESVSAATKSTKDELDRLKDQLASFGTEEDRQKLEKALSELKQKDSEYVSKIAEFRDRISAIKALDAATLSIVNSNGICPYTKESCNSIVAKIEDIKKESILRKAESEQILKVTEQYQSELAEIQVTIRSYEATIANFNTLLNHINTLEATLVDLPQKPNTEKTIAELDAEIEALTQAKMKLQANQQYNTTIENLTNLKYEAELQATALANWVKKTDTNGLQTTLMVKPFEELANVMTGYIQKMYGNDNLKAHFNISTKANSFSFGLIRDRIYIPYDLLSSGEKCLYTLALMICITNNNTSPLKLLLCDDMFDHLDSNAIESTFAALKNIDNIQFIFAGVKDCENAKDVMIKP